MRQPIPSSQDDPTRRVLGGWNLGGAPDTEALLDASLLAPPASPSVQPAAPAFGSRGRSDLDPCHDFIIDPGPSDFEDSLFGPAPPAVSRRSMGPTGGPESSATRSPGTAATRPVAVSGVCQPSMSSPPRPGDLLGGFLIVTELGRGAFARVYLAEQTDLGNRPVALKVSNAEGEEPQMLARLQHTHIVPIHSVHDDPVTGLRLLCMPYLGGANLAQVLEAAGARVSEGPDRLSLVQALDEVSQRLQAGPNSTRSLSSGSRHPASRPVTAEPSRAGVIPISPSRERPRGGPGPRPNSVFPPSFQFGSLHGLNRLWGRVTRGHVVESDEAGRGLDGRDFDQPARQFLRQANTSEAAAWIIARLAEGLEHAHSRGLLHRDLKPSNILIASDGTPMLLDFNLSSDSEASSPAEGEKAMLGGTLPYMSPEHLDAFDPHGTTLPEAVDERSDIYSLGLILFEMVAGEPPFPEPPARLPLVESIRFLSLQRRKVPSLRAAHPGAPWGLESILRTCLDPDPARRYARARELAEDLNRLLDDLPLRHAPELSVRERVAKWSRRNPRLCGISSVAAFSAVLILSLGGLIGLLHNNMQNLTTRLKLQVFRDDLTECRFLLNLASGPIEHLDRGVALAERTLDQQRFDRAGDLRSDSWVRRLTRAEQAAVCAQTAELILLEARARVFRAERFGGENDRRKALEWAVRWLGTAERLDPIPSAALYADRARYLGALGNADLAERDRRLEAQTRPSRGRDYALLGTSLLARGDLARAEPALARAVHLDPRDFWGWFALGHCHFEQGRSLDAAGDFAACVVLEPKFAWPHLNRGLALARAGRLAEARDEYDRALEANPKFAEAWINHALADLELGDLASAERALGKARALGRRDATALAVLAEVRARRGDAAGAEALFRDLLRERPDDPVLLTARGIFRVQKDPEGARADLRRALSADPRNARARYGLARLLRSEDPRAALAEADAALEADANLLDALELRALLRARLGETSALDDAERLIRVPTANRLYNAACALSLLTETAGEVRLAPRALDLLARALEAGFPARHASADADLVPLRHLPGFRALMRKALAPEKTETRSAPPEAASSSDQATGA